MAETPKAILEFLPVGLSAPASDLDPKAHLKLSFHIKQRR